MGNLRLQRPELIRSIIARSDDLFPEIDGVSGEVLSLKRDMACVSADAEVTVLITGESGHG